MPSGQLAHIVLRWTAVLGIAHRELVESACLGRIACGVAEPGGSQPGVHVEGPWKVGGLFVMSQRTGGIALLREGTCQPVDGPLAKVRRGFGLARCQTESVSGRSGIAIFQGCLAAIETSQNGVGANPGYLLQCGCGANCVAFDEEGRRLAKGLGCGELAVVPVPSKAAHRCKENDYTHRHRDGCLAVIADPLPRAAGEFHELIGPA